MRVGLDELAVYLARGQPAFYWNTSVGPAWCRTLLYGTADPSFVDVAVYSCGGVVAHIARVAPALPCWRVGTVAPRIVADAEYFDHVPLARQWQIVAGILERGQSGRDVDLAFGRPYNTGVEAREDGTNATSRVYLDSTADSYGLYVTLVGDHVVGWRIPPDRTLTPEAQQRRLAALERHLVAQMQQTEARSIERHREEMALIGNVQSQSQQMVDALASQPTAVIQAGPSGGAGGEQGGGGGGGGATVSGSTELTLQGCRFTDRPGGELGTQCGNCPGCAPGCSASYTCYVIAGTSGVCVPAAQLSACH